MRHLLRVAIGTLGLLALTAGTARAETTAAQLIELSRAGLSDDILIALIQTDGSTFQLSAADIIALHREGLSDKVIKAMIETARKPTEPPRPPAADDRGQETIQINQGAPMPVAPSVVNVHQTVTQRVEPSPASRFPYYYSIPVTLPVYLPAAQTPRPTTPVYWGWGGKRRPDSWDDRPTGQPDPKSSDKKDQNR